VSAALRRAAYGFGIEDLREFGVLVRTLAVAQFRLRYLDSALSYVWAVARPAMLFGVLYTVFTLVGRLNHNVPHYGQCVFTSIVLWTFFAETTATATTSLVHNGGLLRKLPVSPLAIPLSVVLSSLFDLGMSMVAVLAFILVGGVDPTITWLELPAIVLAMSVLATGTAMILSTLYVRYRDVNQIWVVVRQALFYASPIIFVATKLPPRAEHLALLNPIAVVLTQARHALIDPHAPTAAEAAGGAAHLLVPMSLTMATFALGVWMFRRRGPWLAEAL
jgi:ABC-2 type transport system permease protein